MRQATALIALLAFALGAAPAAAQKSTKPDTVMLKNNMGVIEGTVSKDDFQEVRIKPKKGAQRTIKAEEVARVEYGDWPQVFSVAIQQIDQGRYSDGLKSIQRAEAVIKEIEEDQTRPRLRRRHPNGVIPKAARWVPYSTFYKALCMRMTRDYIGASKHYQDIIDGHKNFRLIREAYVGAMRAAIDRSDPDEAKAKAVLAAARAERARLGERLTSDLELAQIEVYIRTENFSEAQPMYEKLASSGVEAVAVQGVRGVLFCMMKEDKDVASYCSRLMSGRSNKVKMIASAALGEAGRRKAEDSGSIKDFLKAVTHLVNATVVYYPGRGSGMEPDHEDALLTLAACYEGMASKSSATKAVRSYRTMADQTYREFFAAHANSPRAEDAGRRMGKNESKIPQAGSNE